MGDIMHKGQTGLSINTIITLILGLVVILVSILLISSPAEDLSTEGDTTIIDAGDTTNCLVACFQCKRGSIPEVCGTIDDLNYETQNCIC